MQIVLNGSPHQLSDVATALELLLSLNIPRERVAVVVNENVVRRANLEQTPLSEGDVVEVITMVGGG